MELFYTRELIIFCTVLLSFWNPLPLTTAFSRVDGFYDKNIEYEYWMKWISHDRISIDRPNMFNEQEIDTIEHWTEN